MWFRMDLDRVYTLDSLWVWNYNQATMSDRSLKDVVIEYSLTGGSDSSEWTKLGDYTFNEAIGDVNYAHNTEVSFGQRRCKVRRYSRQAGKCFVVSEERARAENNFINLLSCCGKEVKRDSSEKTQRVESLKR